MTLERQITGLMQDGRERTVDDIHRAIGGVTVGDINRALGALTREGRLSRDRQAPTPIYRAYTVARPPHRQHSHIKGVTG